MEKDNKVEENVSDAERVAHSEKKKELERLQELADIRKLLSLPEGVRYFKKFFKNNHLFTTSMAGNAPMTYFNEGRRNVALNTLDKITSAAPSKLAELLMTKEDD